MHRQAWAYIGGSNRYVVLDNFKEGVLKPDLYEPALNPVYAATLAHFEVVADQARVQNPNRKWRGRTRFDTPSPPRSRAGASRASKSRTPSWNTERARGWPRAFLRRILKVSFREMDVLSE